MANTPLSPLLKDIGARLHTARTTKGIELEDAAEAGEILIDELVRIEEGSTDYSIHALLKLCVFYEIGLEEVLS